MAQYSVRANDTPFSIAKRFTGNPARMTELVRVNPHKRPVHVRGQTTFSSLGVGEKLNLPMSWIGLHGVPQGLGLTPTAGIDLPTAWANLLAVMSAGAVQCSSASPYPYPASQQVMDFQQAYQTAAAVAGSGLTPIPNDSSGASPVDGELGPNTLAAMNAYIATIPGGTGYTLSCGSGDTLTQVTVTPNPSPTPTPTPTPTPGSTTTTTSGSAWLLVALAAVAAVGGYYWLRHKGGAQHIQAGAAKVRGHLKRAGRRVAARRRLHAARRRR